MPGVGRAEVRLCVCNKSVNGAPNGSLLREPCGVLAGKFEAGSLSFCALHLAE